MSVHGAKPMRIIDLFAPQVFAKNLDRSASGGRRSRRQALRAWWSALVRGQAGLSKAHPHMLRHACGFALANKGHDTRALQAYLGHRNIQHTVRYTELSPGRFKDFWR